MASSTSFGIDAVAGYLDGRKVAYEVIEHRVTYSATAEAKAAGIPVQDAAKTIVLRGDEGYRLAVIPASERLDMHKVRDAFGETSHMRMASEEEMEKDFPMFELGAVPPFAEMLGSAPEIVDRRLMEHDRILCSGGDHKHAVLIDPQDIVRVAHPKLDDLCQD
jgi:Ala-tRNA(Pro) deacylase